MSGTIRISQGLKEGYNPDGTPGSVSAGDQGEPGRPPTVGEIADAVADYIANNPITLNTVSVTNEPETRFGIGATGTPGSYLAVGSTSALHAFILAAGTPQAVNLYLQSQNGRVIADGVTEVTGTLTVDGLLRAVTGATLEGITTVSDASIGTSDSTITTGALAEVIATPVHSFTVNGNVERGVLAADLNAAVSAPGSKISLLSLIATLWLAMQELELRERTT